MVEDGRLKYLRVALAAVGVIFIVGIYSLVMIWPSGWSWHSGESHHLPHYLQMILGVYATLGVFLLIASRNPLQHLSLIWFTVWSSVVHELSGEGARATVLKADRGPRAGSAADCRDYVD